MFCFSFKKITHLLINSDISIYVLRIYFLDIAHSHGSYAHKSGHSPQAYRLGLPLLQILLLIPTLLKAWAGLFPYILPDIK